MLAGRCWIFLITVASTFSRIFALRADLDARLIRSKYACENDVMHLVCGQSTVLDIQAADFGESTALICGKSEASNQLCQLMDKTETVKTRCDNKLQCSIVAMRSIFGDPCQGINKQTPTEIYLNVMYACVKPTNGGTSTEITPTRPSSGILTSEENATNTTISTSALVNLTMTANTTQPTSTEPNKKSVLSIRSEEEGPKTQKVIPVFDPAKSVDLEVMSATASVMSSSVVVFLIWVCIIGVISDCCF